MQTVSNPKPYNQVYDPKKRTKKVSKRPQKGEETLINYEKREKIKNLFLS